MKYTFCERMIWISMSGAIFKFLERACPGVSIKSWKKRAKGRYKEIIADLDDIGSIKDNPLRAPLAGGSLWLAVYETSKGRMDEALFGEMVPATMESFLMKKMFTRADPFTRSFQEKKMVSNEKSNAISDSPFNWHCELIPGRDEEEYTIIYRQCGLCALGKKLGHPELIPYMCKMDYISIGLMGGVLHRSQTLAEGGACCDFYVCKKGSKWDVNG